MHWGHSGRSLCAAGDKAQGGQAGGQEARSQEGRAQEGARCKEGELRPSLTLQGDLRLRRSLPSSSRIAAGSSMVRLHAQAAPKKAPAKKPTKPKAPKKEKAPKAEAAPKAE